MTGPETANRRIHGLLQQLAREGARDEDLASILMAYSLSLAFRSKGRAGLAEYLRRWSDTFGAAAEAHSFEQIARHGPADRRGGDRSAGRKAA